MSISRAFPAATYTNLATEHKLKHFISEQNIMPHMYNTDSKIKLYIYFFSVTAVCFSSYTGNA